MHDVYTNLFLSKQCTTIVLYLWRQKTKLSIVFMLIRATHTHTHTHKKRKNLIGISFNPLTICKKHTRLVADGLWVSVRVHHPNRHYDFDYYHWVYYHCRSENLLYIIFWCAILFFYCCTPIVYTVHCTGGDFLFAKSNRNSNNILPFHSNHFVEFT